jgi:hypothetical protein
MPSIRRTPFSATYEPDAFDASDRFNAESAQRARELLMARLDRSGELQQQDDWHRAAIGEQGREFDAGREDNRSMAQLMLAAREKELASQDAREGRRFDYMAGRDAAADSWRNREYEDTKPSRDASTQLMLAQIARMQAEQGRTDRAANVAPIADLSPQDLAESNAIIAAGGTQAQANLATLDKRKKRGYEEADVLGEDLASSAKDFSDRDNKVFGSDPTEEDDRRIVLSAKALEKKYIDLGDSPAVARAKAMKKVKDSVKTSANSQHVDFVLQSLGIVK